MRSFLSKLTSRKFIACVAGVVTGIALIVNGNTVEGVTSVIASVVGYIIAEGYVDSKAVKSTITISKDVLDGVLKDFEDFEDFENQQTEGAKGEEGENDGT